MTEPFLRSQYLYDIMISYLPIVVWGNSEKFSSKCPQDRRQEGRKCGWCESVSTIAAINVTCFAEHFLYRWMHRRWKTCIFLIVLTGPYDHLLSICSLFRLLADGGWALTVWMGGLVIVTVSQMEECLVERISTVAIYTGRTAPASQSGSCLNGEGQETEHSNVNAPHREH